MFVYIMRRIIAGAFVMVGASFIVYLLMTQAGNPLAFTLAITNPTQRASVIDEVTRTLSLDVPPVQRYLEWLKRLVFEQDFGLVSVTQQRVGHRGGGAGLGERSVSGPSPTNSHGESR